MRVERGCMKEEWKEIKGFEGLYEISNMGNVRSLPRYTTKGKILKCHKNKSGYIYVCLSKNNKRTNCRVHCLVMNAFNPISKKCGYDKKWTIDHIDGDKSNNKLSNLEWCSQSENQKRAYNIGLQKKQTKKVIDITTDIVYESVTQAADAIGANKVGLITRVCQGKRSNYRNHKFAYYEDFINQTIPLFKGKPKRSCEKLWRE